MDFRDILKGGAPKPSISVNRQGAVVTIPSNILKTAKLSAGSKIKLQFAEQGKRRAIRLVPDDNGAFVLSSRKSVCLLQSPELTPKTSVEGKHDLNHELCPEGHLVLTLPDNWALARPDVVAVA